MFYIKRLTLIALFLVVRTFVFAQVDEQQLLNDIDKYKVENKLPQAAEALNKLAFYYWENSKPEKALQAFEQSVALNIEIRNNNAVKAIYSNMGMIYSDMGEPETALVYFRKSLLLSRSQKNKQDIATNLMNISVSLRSLDRNDEALDNLKEAENILVELKNKQMLRTCYGSLSEIYKEMGDARKSMEYFNLYVAFQKQIQDDEIENQRKQNEQKVAAVEQKAQKAIKEKEQTQQQLSVTQDSLKISEEQNQIKQLQIQKQKAEIENQRLLTLIFIIGMGFVAIVALLIFRSNLQKKKHNIILEKRNEEIRKQNEEIQAKNHKINQSINYAKNIQGALLPEISDLNKLFDESFIYFSPRDVVSGDFYWFDEVTINNNKLKIVAAVDCTGHGVPGAFMSMLGMSFLEEIILDKHLISPDEILEQMHNMVRFALKQENTGNTDGMDMVICVYDELRKIIKFAGAVNSLVYIQDDKMDVIKGDFFGIGGQMKTSAGRDNKFTVQTLDVSKPTTCYIFSDGFSDQFGGEKGGKYFLKNFRELLFSIHKESMDEQNKILEQKLLEWQGDKYQRVDDVLVMGFRI